MEEMMNNEMNELVVTENEEIEEVEEIEAEDFDEGDGYGMKTALTILAGTVAVTGVVAIACRKKIAAWKTKRDIKRLEKLGYDIRPNCFRVEGVVEDVQDEDVQTEDVYESEE